METGVQNSAGKTGGLEILPVRIWSTQLSMQLTTKARKGMRLWE